QGSAYLCRRTIYHARWKQRLEVHLVLLRCYCNFVRPHRALKFGREVRTPAMQAGLAGRRLTLREIFSSGMVFLSICEIGLVCFHSAPSFSGDNVAPRFPWAIPDSAGGMSKNSPCTGFQEGQFFSLTAQDIFSCFRRSTVLRSINSPCAKRWSTLPI